MNLHQLLRQNVAGKLLNHLLVFAINILIVRNISAAGSGAFFNEYYVVSFLVFLFSLGLDYAAIAWITSNPSLISLIHSRLISIVFFFVTILLVIGLVIFPELNINTVQPVWGLILFGAGNLMLVFFQGILSAQKKFNLQNWILLISNFLFACILFWGLPHFKENKLIFISIAYGALILLQGLIMAFMTYQSSDDLEHSINWKGFYRHGYRIMISSLIYFCFLRVDNLFVEKYCDPITLSNYVQCGKVGQYFLYFSSVISSTLLPFIAAEKIGQSFTAWQQLMRPYILLICVGAVGLALFGRFLYPFVFGADFKEMNQYMLLFLPGYVCLGILTLVNAIYIGKGNIQKIFRGDLLGLIFVVVLDFILVPRYGVFAAATVSTVGYCLVFFYLWSGIQSEFEK